MKRTTALKSVLAVAASIFMVGAFAQVVQKPIEAQATATPQTSSSPPLATINSAVETLPDGVTIQHLIMGLGKQPGHTSHVEVRYVGQLADGTVFDSTAKHGGKPIALPLDHVVKCWSESLVHMRAGGTAIIHCPSETAYGDVGAGAGVIPPNADLTFKVNLVAVQ